MNAKAEKQVEAAVVIKKPNAAPLIERLRECAIYKVVVENLDRSLLAVIADESHITLRNSLQARITDIGPLLSELYTDALIAADMEPHELNVHSLTNDCVRLRYGFALAK